MSSNKEIWMETTHGRKSKCKTEFKAVLNKVLLSTLVLTTVLGSATPAFAAEAPHIDYPTTSYTQEYGISVESAISNIQNTIAEINRNRANGSIVDSKLQELSTQLLQLQSAVSLNGGKVDTKVILVLNDAEKTVNQFDSKAAESAQTALSVVKSMLGVDSVTVENKFATLKSFEDVPSNHWAHKSIMLCVQHGAVSGTVAPDANGVGKYDVDGKVTLGQFLAVITRLVCPDQIEDVGGHWATGNYIAAVKSGIIRASDFESTDGALNSNLSRQDMAYILVRAAAANGEDLQEMAGIKGRINDYNSIAGNRQTHVLKAYSNGLLMGDNNGNFSPHGTTTRAQMAAVVCRLMEYEARPEVKEVIEDLEEDIQDNAYVVTEGENAGKLKPAYADQNAKEFYASARFYKDANGNLAFKVTAPNVPDLVKQFNPKYSFSISVYDKSDKIIASGQTPMLEPGQSVDITYTDAWGETFSVSDIGNIVLGFACGTDAGTMKNYRASLSWDTAIAGQYPGRMEMEQIDFNATHIFEGLGL